MTCPNCTCPACVEERRRIAELSLTYQRNAEAQEAQMRSSLAGGRAGSNWYDPNQGRGQR